jgi:fatty-acyl-CoA synthase
MHALNAMRPSCEETRRDWRRATFGDALRWGAEQYADREAVVWHGQRITYREFGSRVRAFARGLIEVGVGRGEKVALWMADRPEWLIARWAVPMIGAILVPVNTRLRGRDVSYVLAQSDTENLIIQDCSRGVSYLDILGEVDPVFREHDRNEWRSQPFPALRRAIGIGTEVPKSMTAFEDIEALGCALERDGQLETRMSAVHCDDVAQILYTSGTTSFPKGAMVCHGPLLQNNWFATSCLALGPDDRYLSCVPLFTATGTFYTLALFLSGGAMVIADHFEPRLFCELVQRERITVSFFVDTIVQDLRSFDERSRFDLSSLRTGTGAPLPTASFDWVTRELGIPQLVSAYGMSETSNAVVRTRVDDSYEKRSRTNGRPVEGVGIRIADVETNEELPAGRIGEICVSGYVLMKGYYKLPEEDRKAIDEAGWLHTGDLGEVDEEGYLTYRGRVKEMIKPGGFNVATQEIEVFLKTYPGVKEAVVVGVPDARLGEVAYAYVEVRAGTQVKGEALQRYCKEHIAGYKVPRYVEFVDTWPLTGSQKIRKLELKDRAARARAAAIMQT